MKEVKSIFSYIKTEDGLYQAVAFYVICDNCQTYLKLREGAQPNSKAEWAYQCPNCGKTYYSLYLYPYVKYEPAGVSSYE